MRILNKSIVILLLPALALFSCKKELNVGNPNQPTIDANVTNEAGIVSLTLGGIYINGFGNGNLAWLGNSYFSLPYGYSELMGDMVAAEASNQIVNIVNIPDYYILDDGTRIDNPAPSREVLRTNNNRASTGQGNNPFYYSWTALYSMNNACNTIIGKADAVSYTGDAVAKANTVKAYCYWWKGWLYANLGTLYYSGLIVNTPNATNSTYKIHDDIIAESNVNFNRADSLLTAIGSSENDYSEILTRLIPAFNQTNHGGVPTIDEWKRNINTMLARNILLNRLSPFVNGNPDATITGSSLQSITSADWSQILTLAGNGIQDGDVVFTGETVDVNGYFSAAGGSASANSTGPNRSATFKVSERFIQYFKAGDKRKSNNFDASESFTSGGTFGTRYSQVDGGNSQPGVYVYGSKSVGGYEVYEAGSYEENALMLAEANIRTGNIEAGLGYIDAVRQYQGAGLAPVKGTGLTLAQALQELVSERRVALAYRNISFFDSRRWGWTYDISKGGGSYHNTVLNGDIVNTNATINYNFLDYWDVPADESDLNMPDADSAPVMNPN